MAELDDLFAAAVADHQAGRLGDARARLEDVLARAPDHAGALHRLGVICFQEGDAETAIALLTQATEAKIPDPQAFGNLGAVLLRENDYEAAERALARAAALAPGAAEHHYNLGLARRGLGNFDGAEASYRRAIELDPRHAAAHNNLGNLLTQVGREREAEECFRAAVAADPGFAPAQRNLADSLEADGDLDGAREAFAAAIHARPEDDGARIRMAMLLPAVARSSRHLADARAAFEAEIDRLADERLCITDPLREVGATVFLDSYHGVSDRAVHEKLAAMLARACPGLEFAAPHCVDWRWPVGERIHVGFVSAFFREHTIARLNEGLIKRLPRDRFRVTLFSASSVEDEVTSELRAAADAFTVLPADLSAARETIAAARPDILYFTDIGMEPMSYFLAFARLAPVQCATWGHPDTTGISNVDYFISSALAEPDGAEAEYSERLVKLPCFTTSVARPQGTALSREDLGIAEDAKLFVCPQSLFKFHPDFDALIDAILADDRRSELLLIHGNRRAWSADLRERLGRTVAERIDQVRFLPRLDRGQFLGLLGAADVVLDTPHFCGGMTSYQALAMGAPVVTLPGAFMRGQLSLGLMREMGMEDTVATTPEAYIETALTLANDPVFAKTVRSGIAERAGALFDSTVAVAEHARFFERAIETAVGRDLSDD